MCRVDQHVVPDSCLPARAYGPAHRAATAIAAGDRAEAWFQIRYRSAASGTQGAGIVVRRFAESTLFGLYEVNGPTDQEAVSVYQAVQRNRRQIVEWEGRFGVRADGTSGQQNLVAAAVSTYEASIGDPTLVTLLDPAKGALLAWRHALCKLNSKVIIGASVGGSAGSAANDQAWSRAA
jgi:hypothetical protein